MKKGFTMVDNNVYDYLMGADLTCTELKILLAIIRYTTGFHRDECTLTASFISRITKKGVRTVRYALKELCDKGLILKKHISKNGIITYSLGIFEDAINCSGSVQSVAQEGVQSVAPNKYNNINKNFYINKGRKSVIPTPKATKFSNFESKHIIDYKRLEMEALRRRIERNRQDSS